MDDPARGDPDADPDGAMEAFLAALEASNNQQYVAQAALMRAALT